MEADVATLAKVILSELGLDSGMLRTVPDRPSLDRRYLLDSSKLRSELGWAPTIDFTAGLKDTIAWYAENEQWWRPLIGRSPVVEETAWQK